jgi:hypothetical protein
MIDKWMTANEIAQLLSLKNKRSLNIRAQREGWTYRSYAVRGGRERRYRLASLLEDIQIAYAANIKITLEEL